MKEYEVYISTESTKEELFTAFPRREHAESFINGKLLNHIVDCGRIYWSIERFEDEWAISVGVMLTKYRINAVEI